MQPSGMVLCHSNPEGAAILCMGGVRTRHAELPLQLTVARPHPRLNIRLAAQNEDATTILIKI